MGLLGVWLEEDRASFYSLLGLSGHYCSPGASSMLATGAGLLSVLPPSLSPGSLCLRKVPKGGELRAVMCRSDSTGGSLLAPNGPAVLHGGLVNAGGGEGVRKGMGRAFLSW